MSAFSPAQRQYLQRRRLARLGTVGRDGIPHVSPIWMWRLTGDVMEVRGRDLAASKKFRDVQRSGAAAIVVDDLASLDPWRPRGVEVRGRAEAVTEPDAVIRIQPDRVIGWGFG